MDRVRDRGSDRWTLVQLQLGDDLGVVVTYDVRMADAAAKLGPNTQPPV